MSRSGPTRRAAVSGLLVLAGIGLLFLPPAVTKRMKSVVRELVRPGQQFAGRSAQTCRVFAQSLTANYDAQQEIDRLTQEVSHWQQQSRHWQLWAVKQRQQADDREADQSAGLPVASTSRLFLPEMHQAEVLGDEIADRWRSGLMIGRGKQDGLEESALVLEDPLPLIDIGRDAQLDVGHDVFAGRNVVGRIAQVGLWTSTVKPITDSSFNGYAQLARQTPDGLALGAEGILEGTGKQLCRLTNIPETAAVGVGDLVLTSTRNSSLPEPMYYGKVTQAELKPGATHWDVLVEPAMTLTDIRHVTVLQPTLNPRRVRTAQHEEDSSARN